MAVTADHLAFGYFVVDVVNGVFALDHVGYLGDFCFAV